MPKLWRETIEDHRRDVREAIVETTVGLVGEHGLRSVTMSQIATETGIGRATLYKYFSDAEAILRAWHERQITRHLHHLAAARDGADGAGNRLRAVLEAYALMSYESRRQHDSDLGRLMHRGEHVARAERQLRHMVRDLIRDAQEDGGVRADAAPGELVSYCLHALDAARTASSKAAVRRVVDLTLAGMRG